MFNNLSQDEYDNEIDVMRQAYIEEIENSGALFEYDWAYFKDYDEIEFTGEPYGLEDPGYLESDLRNNIIHKKYESSEIHILEIPYIVKRRQIEKMPRNVYFMILYWKNYVSADMTIDLLHDDETVLRRSETHAESLTGQLRHIQSIMNIVQRRQINDAVLFNTALNEYMIVHPQGHEGIYMLPLPLISQFPIRVASPVIFKPYETYLSKAETNSWDVTRHVQLDFNQIQETVSFRLKEAIFLPVAEINMSILKEENAYIPSADLLESAFNEQLNEIIDTEQISWNKTAIGLTEISYIDYKPAHDPEWDIPNSYFQIEYVSYVYSRADLYNFICRKPRTLIREINGRKRTGAYWIGSDLLRWKAMLFETEVTYIQTNKTVAIEKANYLMPREVFENVILFMNRDLVYLHMRRSSSIITYTKFDLWRRTHLHISETLFTAIGFNEASTLRAIGRLRKAIRKIVLLVTKNLTDTITPDLTKWRIKMI
ncbi:MAG: hypothetical protein ACRYGG_11425 [Janthinobacterium lividum]